MSAADEELLECADVAAEKTRELATLLILLAATTPAGEPVTIDPEAWTDLTALVGRARSNAEAVAVRLSAMLERTP